MARAKKLSSGNWRTQVFDYKDKNGKSHYRSFTAETKAESEQLASEFTALKQTGKAKQLNRLKLTVRECIEEYIAISQVLSKSTLSAYDTILRFAFQDIMNVQIADLDDLRMQQAINAESRRITVKGTLISPKTVKNEYGLLEASINTVCKIKFNIKLPKAPRNISELPNAKTLIDIFKGTDIELPVMMAMWLSFSYSELRGLYWSPIRDGIIYVERVTIDTKYGRITKELGKAEQRIRKLFIPNYIMNLIEENPDYQNYIKNGIDSPIVKWQGRSLYKKFKKLVEANGIDMTFHNLRAVNASVMLAQGIPDKYAMERGGWKTPHTMKSVYQRTFSEERVKVDNKIDEYFESLIDGKI